jgi:RNA polymerase sigma factor (sigma-70 family)
LRPVKGVTFSACHADTYCPAIRITRGKIWSSSPVPKGSQRSRAVASLKSIQGEEGLVDALRRGEPEAERRVVSLLREELRNGGSNNRGLLLLQEAFRNRVVGWLTHTFFAGDLPTAEEAWNDTLYRVWTRVKQYDESRSRFGTWVWNQARYAALDLRRKRRADREVPYPGEEPSSKGGEGEETTDVLRKRLDEGAMREFEEPEPLTRAEERAIRRALGRLTNTEQWLLRLRYVYGFRNVDIARQELAGRPLPEEHVRVYVNRATKRLRAYYEEELHRQASKRGR